MLLSYFWFLMMIFSHPSQERFEGLSDLLSLSVASLCNDVNDCIFICSCKQYQAVTFVKKLFCKVLAALMCFSFLGYIPNPFMAFLSACASAAGSKLDAGRTVGLS